MLFVDKIRKKSKPRDSEQLLRRRVEKLHPGDSPRSIEALIEKVRQMEAEVWKR